jgi:hypothetical protein
MNETVISAAPGAPGADSPFHEGELAAQRRAGFLDAADLAGRRSIRDYLPDQHRQFYEHLPFMVIGGVDRFGQPWATMRVGQPGFISSPDPRTLRIAGDTLPGDPLDGAWHRGALFGGLGIELPTRRRNRINGTVTDWADDVLTVHVGQSFGNCARYIQARTPEWIDRPSFAPSPALSSSSALSDADRALLGSADTLFIASAHEPPNAGAAHGVDVSHRGGMPGFVRVEDAGTFVIPDYAGNRFLNTVGNLTASPRAGLLFPDFKSGDLLYVAADAEIVWEGAVLNEFEDAQRVMRFHVRETRRTAGALPFRWTAPQYAPQFKAMTVDPDKTAMAAAIKR